MLKQVLVVNHETFRTTGSIGDIAVGQLASIKEGAPAPIALGDKEVQLAVGRNGGGLYVTPPLNFGELKRHRRIPYSGGTAQVSTVTLVDNDQKTWHIKLMDLTVQTLSIPAKTYEVKAANVNDAATALRALINADKDVFKDYSAAGSNAAVVITAPINREFKLAVSEGSTIAYTGGSNVRAIPSTGRPSDVQTLWKQALSLTGVTNQTGFPVIQPDSPVDPTAQYDLVVAEFNPIFPARHGMDRTFTEKHMLVIACKAAISQAVFDALSNFSVGSTLVSLDARLEEVEV
jgi:hypothetical protein